jgi:hypothetical protein
VSAVAQARIAFFIVFSLCSNGLAEPPYQHDPCRKRLNNAVPPYIDQERTHPQPVNRKGIRSLFPSP